MFEFTFKGYTAERAYRSFWDYVDPPNLYPSTAQSLAYHVCGGHYGFRITTEVFIDGDYKYTLTSYGYPSWSDQAGAIAALADSVDARVSVRITKQAVNRGRLVTMHQVNLDLATPAEREGTA